LDSFSSNYKVSSVGISGPPSKTRKLEPSPSTPTTTTGVCNFGFEYEDDEEPPKRSAQLQPQVSTEVELPLPPRSSPTEKKSGYTVQNVPEVSVTISRVKSEEKEVPTEEHPESVEAQKLNGERMEEECDMDTENIETDEEFDGSLSVTGTVSEASTIVPHSTESGRLLTKPPVSGARKNSTEGGCGAVGRLRGKHVQGKQDSLPIPKAKRTHSTPSSKKEKERNIKIVEIKSNDIVQGILRMEPHLGPKKEKMAIVKCPTASLHRAGVKVSKVCFLSLSAWLEIFSLKKRRLEHGLHLAWFVL